MIAVIARDLRWRILLLLAVAVAFYFAEPAFHQHEGFDPNAIALGPLGISATLANFAALGMIILLSGFISTELREGYARINLSQPVTPLGYYGLRWGVAYGISILLAAAFLLIGQLIAWGEFLGGWEGMLLPLLSALIYGGLMAFFSSLGIRGDSVISVILLLIPTVFPTLLSAMLGALSLPIQSFVVAVLPPQTALSDVWDGLLASLIPWQSAAFAAAYGALFLTTAALILRLREWP